MNTLSIAGGAALVALSALAWQQVDAERPVDPAPAATDCEPGFTPREAQPADRHCVGWMSRHRVELENRLAPGRMADSNGSAACRAPYVRREAVPGDHVCVTVASRRWVLIENTRASAQP